ncbi:MAG: DUF465 domain-containing protein [Gammaproteobacteria bacterium]|nr:DUF465 domain-containing protein [Gammaproteobacteria bacterium]MBI5616953.1 DUF465 domain-containing protein [Gammaproteobacteria bacterium]
MFEFDQDAVDVLLMESQQFRRLFDKHTALKSRVEDANAGQLAIDQFDLEHLKKEKLLLKDRMAAMIKEFRQVHV